MGRVSRADGPRSSGTKAWESSTAEAADFAQSLSGTTGMLAAVAAAAMLVLSMHRGLGNRYQGNRLKKSVHWDPLQEPSVRYCLRFTRAALGWPPGNTSGRRGEAALGFRL